MKPIKFIISIFLLTFFVQANAQYEKQIDSLFAKYEEAPGCAVAVYKDGKIIFSKGYGYANLDYDIKNTPQTVFDIGSMSKQFTATCIVLLVNDGKISLDDPVRKYIPELPKYSDTIITIRHLIYHTSGIRSFPTLQFIAGIPFGNVTNEEMTLDLITRQKALNFGVGEKYLYNNSGYFLMAVIVKRVSGKSVGEFAKERIFDPLGMTSTFYNENTKRVVKNRAIAYVKKDSVTFERNHHFEAVVAGAGGIHTTVEDFQKWDENYYSQKIGGKNYYKTMHTKGILNNGDTLDYAFGLMSGTYKGIKYVGHGGGWGAFVSSYIRFPEQHMSFVGYSNAGFSPRSKLLKMADLYLEKYLEKEEVNEGEVKIVKLPQSTLKQYEGRYELKEPGLIIEASFKDDTLRMFQSWNKSKYPIIPISDTVFVLKDVDNLTFTFQNLKNGEAGRMKVFQNGQNSNWDRVDEAPKELNLKDYEGEFYSEELLCTYNFFIENDTLNVKLKYQDPIKLDISKKDIFVVAGNKITFFRSPKTNKIVGIIVDAGRANGIRFEKK